MNMNGSNQLPSPSSAPGAPNPQNPQVDGAALTMQLAAAAFAYQLAASAQAGQPPSPESPPAPPPAPASQPASQPASSLQLNALTGALLASLGAAGAGPALHLMLASLVNPDAANLLALELASRQQQQQQLAGLAELGDHLGDHLGEQLGELDGLAELKEGGAANLSPESPQQQQQLHNQLQLAALSQSLMNHSMNHNHNHNNHNNSHSHMSNGHANGLAGHNSTKSINGQLQLSLNHNHNQNHSTNNNNNIQVHLSNNLSNHNNFAHNHLAQHQQQQHPQHHHTSLLGGHHHHSSIQTQQQLLATKGFNPLAVHERGQLADILTPTHLKKAKLMFFYVRYPNSSILKDSFRDVRFNKNNTAQLVKWFSNFREFYYIQMEKYAREAVNDPRVRCKEDIEVDFDHDLINQLNNHYNKNRHIDLPEEFRSVVEETLRHFYEAIELRRDQEQSWKKAIYKVIARLDRDVPDLFKTDEFSDLLE